MKKIILYAGLTCMAFSLHAQNETELLQNYKYRFQQYRRYGFSLDGGNRLYLSTSNYKGNTAGKVELDYTQNYGISGGFSRFYMSNTEHSQYSSTFSIYASANSGNDWNGISKQLFENLFYNVQNRIYKVPNKFKFYDVTLSASDNHGRQKYAANNAEHLKYTNYDYTYPSLNANVGLGRGRLEYVSDVSFALFWLADMQKKGIIGNYNNENVYEIAKALTKTRNTRIMDFRFNTIGQMEMLDSAFQHSGMLKKKDAAYFTTLYDHYLYANNYTRYHGKRLDYGVNMNPYFGYSYSIYKRDTGINHYSSSGQNFGNSVSLFILRTVNKAVSLRNQLNYYYGINVGEDWQIYTSLSHANGYSRMSNSSVNPFAVLKGGVEWQRFQNSRNSISFGIFGFLNVISDAPTTFLSTLNLQPRIQYYHWFSPKLNISVSAGIQDWYRRNYVKKEWNSYHNINENFNFSFNYLFY